MLVFQKVGDSLLGFFNFLVESLHIEVVPAGFTLRDVLISVEGGALDPGDLSGHHGLSFADTLGDSEVLIGPLLNDLL